MRILGSGRNPHQLCHLWCHYNRLVIMLFLNCRGSLMPMLRRIKRILLFKIPNFHPILFVKRFYVGFLVHWCGSGAECSLFLNKIKKKKNLKKIKYFQLQLPQKCQGLEESHRQRIAGDPGRLTPRIKLIGRHPTPLSIHHNQIYT